MANTRTKAQPPPTVYISESDFDALDRLVGDLPGSGPAGLLQAEMDRAEVLPEAEMPKGVVGLHRWVHFRDGQGNDVRRVQLVLPRDADIDAGRISVLSYVGAGLLGLTEGETIEWPSPSGGSRPLTIIMVEDRDPIAELAH
ncbi:MULTISPECIES: GreA/GreB family elongation factor [unclassified Brevundimonas]|uniref:GreA/GreB family elongation factor n=1 Tax=unclassified Brevundimonas TaxID=2622653 RepID=UPI0025C2323F|nr:MULTISPECIES: GreA/GreB family elongation factor [unclassified Brevundimonas]